MKGWQIIVKLSRVRTILALGYWVLANTGRYWGGSGIGLYFFDCEIQYRYPLTQYKWSPPATYCCLSWDQTVCTSLHGLKLSNVLPMSSHVLFSFWGITKQIMTGVSIITKNFFPSVRKIMPSIFDLRQHFTISGPKLSMMTSTPVTICILYHANFRTCSTLIFSQMQQTCCANYKQLKQTETSYGGRASSAHNWDNSVRYFSTFCFRRCLNWSASCTNSSSKLPMCVKTSRFLADLCSPTMPMSSHMAVSFSIPLSTFWRNSAIIVSILHTYDKHEYHCAIYCSHNHDLPQYNTQ